MSSRGCTGVFVRVKRDANEVDIEWKEETYEMRESKWPWIGSCIESIIGAPD